MEPSPESCKLIQPLQSLTVADPDLDPLNLLYVKYSIPYTPETSENQDPETKKGGKKRKLSNIKKKGVNEKAADGMKFQCERCPLTFDDIIDLDDHRKKEHSFSYRHLTPYGCKKCGHSYTQTSYFLQHMRLHLGEYQSVET